MDHRVFRFATRGQCIKGKKLDCFEHNHIFCFKLQCAGIVVLLYTAIWWKSKDVVVHQDWLTKTIAQNVPLSYEDYVAAEATLKQNQRP